MKHNAKASFERMNEDHKRECQPNTESNDVEESTEEERK